MKSTSVIAIASLAWAASANPVPAGPKSHAPNVCTQTAVAQVVSMIELEGPIATPYCINYLLNAPPATITATDLETTITTETLTVTVNTTTTTTTTAPSPIATVYVDFYANCDIKGSPIKADYLAILSSNSANFASCSAACKANKQCVSFAYGNGLCLFFDVTSATNVNVDPSGPYTFFDKNCPQSTTSGPVVPVVARALPRAALPQASDAAPTPSAAPTSSAAPTPTADITSQACACIFTGLVNDWTTTVTSTTTLTTDVIGGTTTDTFTDTATYTPPTTTTTATITTKA